MKRTRETRFPWHLARRVTPEETERFRRAIEESTGKPRAPRGRPPLPAAERSVPTTIRFPLAVLERAKRQAARRGIGYQTVITETLMKHL